MAIGSVIMGLVIMASVIMGSAIMAIDSVIMAAVITGSLIMGSLIMAIGLATTGSDSMLQCTQDLHTLTVTVEDGEAAFNGEKDSDFKTVAHAFWVALHRCGCARNTTHLT